jgi:hypothetical protein
MAVIPGIDAACKTRGVRGFQATYSATPPLLDFHVMTPYGLNERAIAFNRATVDFAVAKRVDITTPGVKYLTYTLCPATVGAWHTKTLAHCHPKPKKTFAVA